VSVFRQSQAVRINAPACRYCSQPVVPGTDLCERHMGEAGRLLAQPRRAGYRDPAYWRARRVAIRRAAGTCEACGSALSLNPAGRVVCQTHHKDRDPRNNDPANLLVCCLACHSGSRRPD
jgi:hypothetical protein